MNAQCKEELENAQTMQQMVDILQKYYDLNKPFTLVSGPLVKGNLIPAIDKMLLVTGIQERKRKTFFS